MTLISRQVFQPQAQRWNGFYLWWYLEHFTLFTWINAITHHHHLPQNIVSCTKALLQLIKKIWFNCLFPHFSKLAVPFSQANFPRYNNYITFLFSKKWYSDVNHLVKVKTNSRPLTVTVVTNKLQCCLMARNDKKQKHNAFHLTLYFNSF